MLQVDEDCVDDTKRATFKYFVYTKMSLPLFLIISLF